METAVLLQRQMELHGTLRHPPRSAADLASVHQNLRDLLDFFETVCVSADRLGTSPETVFQCLMHIGIGGDAVSFDTQRRDGAVPMHQAKVLTRANAMALEPKLRAAVSEAALRAMVDRSKRTRTMLRMKIEDANDFDAARCAIGQFVEYLDFLAAAAGGDASGVFDLYMVGDASTLLALLRRPDAPTEAAVAAVPLPSPAAMPAACVRLARRAAAPSVPAGERVGALRTLGDFVRRWPDAACARAVWADAGDELLACALERRSAVCRAGCAVYVAAAARLSVSVWGAAALHAHCAALTRRVGVTVSAIAGASDVAVRALVVGSGGDAAALRGVLEALGDGAQPERRRRAVGYLALGVVASGGAAGREVRELALAAPHLAAAGDSGGRRMARALCIALDVLAGVRAPVADGTTARLMRQEEAALRPVLGDVRLFEETIFGPRAELEPAEALCTGEARVFPPDAERHEGEGKARRAQSIPSRPTERRDMAPPSTHTDTVAPPVSLWAGAERRGNPPQQERRQLRLSDALRQKIEAASVNRKTPTRWETKDGE